MSSAKWDDLKPRVFSAIVMILIGAAAVWAGGVWFLALVAISCGVMFWELLRMAAPFLKLEALAFGILVSLAIATSTVIHPYFTISILLAVVVLGGLWVDKPNRWIFMTYAVFILLGGFGFIELRQGLGLIWLLWLLAVVVATDIAGYGAGRMIGGPKFWPAVSPKKTWSGTAAGWVAAAITGYLFTVFAGLWGGLAAVSVLVAFASQLGDIAESAIKRKCGIKDSSNLIPGHGGFLDRLDGMLGASVLLLLLVLLTGFPPAGG